MKKQISLLITFLLFGLVSLAQRPEPTFYSEKLPAANVKEMQPYYNFNVNDCYSLDKELSRAIYSNLIWYVMNVYSCEQTNELEIIITTYSGSFVKDMTIRAPYFEQLVKDLQNWIY